MTPIGVGSRSGVNLHHPQTTTTGDSSGLGEDSEISFNFKFRALNSQIVNLKYAYGGGRVMHLECQIIQ